MYELPFSSLIFSSSFPISVRGNAGSTHGRRVRGQSILAIQGLGVKRHHRSLKWRSKK